MSTETIATAAERARHALRDSADQAERKGSESRTIAANASKVLDTTRRAWGELARTAQESAESSEATGTSRPPRASQPKKRVVPRRSRWPSLVAALNYWSPKPL